MALYTLHLFAGAGGGILADMLLGHTVVGAVEVEQYPRDVLLARQQDGSLPVFPVWDDVRTFRSDNPDTRDFVRGLCNIRHQLCICGGFPCQDVSVAGSGAGIHGEKTGLWKEFARIIGEIRPRYAFMENSPAILRRGLTEVLKDLAELGYDASWGVVSARDVGAPHERKRWWCIATDTHSAGLEEQCRCIPVTSEFSSFELRGNSVSYARYATVKQPPTPYRGGEANVSQRPQRQTVPRLGGVPNGLATWMDRNLSGTVWCDNEYDIPRLTTSDTHRVARLKALGNGQVPQAASQAWRLLIKSLEIQGE